MKAAFIRETGPATNLVYDDLPTPEPGERQVLVRMGAVSVNPIDTYVRSGLVKMDLPMPFIVGCDLAGTVEKAGSKATRFKSGDRVWCSNQGLLGRQGTFAEWVAVDEDWLHPTPDNVTDEQAAAAALVGITAHLGLFNRAGLKSGETVFVTGGAGGVGSTVVQMAKAAGARVITCAGSDDKVAACRELGADEAFNYTGANISEQLKQLAPDGVNVWWEVTREPDFDAVVGALAPRGRMVLMAGREARPAFPVGPFYVKGCSLHGFAMFTFSPEEQRDCGEDLNRWLGEGKIKPRIGEVLPLAEAARAHQLQEEGTLQHSGKLSGKIVLKPV